MFTMSQEIRINVRTTDQIKRDLEITARLRGLTVSALVNSLVVKAIREEKAIEPQAFGRPAPIAGRIEPGLSRDEIQRQLEQGIPLATHSARKMPTKLDETTTTRKRRAR